MPLRPPWNLEVEIVEIDGDELAILSWPLEPAPEPAAAMLSRAEKQVLVYVCEGRSDAAIASARGTSVRTVQNQVASLLKKLNVGSRHQLVAKVRSS